MRVMCASRIFPVFDSVFSRGQLVSNTLSADTSSTLANAPVIETVCPQTEQQLVDFLLWAYSEHCIIEVIGRGSKRGLGRPITVDKRLDMSGLSGIQLYQPEELVMTAAAGTPLTEIAAALAAHHQYLAFEPPDWGPLFGGEPKSGSIAGAFASNLSGPQRFHSGAARDHLLGFRAVNGRGELFRSGGRVIKNVSGYDLSKLLCGSFGTLAVLAETTFKVMPQPRGECSLLLPGLSPLAASSAMKSLLGTSLPVTGLSYLPPLSSRSRDDSHQSGPLNILDEGCSWLMVRVQALEPTLRDHCRDIKTILANDIGKIASILEKEDSRFLWRWVGNATLFALPQPGVSMDSPSSQSDTRILLTEHIVWRLHIPPACWPTVVERLAREQPIRYLCDWGGGLLWVAPEDPDTPELAADGGAAWIREAVIGEEPGHSGHALLFRGPESLRAHGAVFHPQNQPLAALTGRIKKAFDPAAILNPGRMYQGL